MVRCGLWIWLLPLHIFTVQKCPHYKIRSQVHVLCYFIETLVTKWEGSKSGHYSKSTDHRLCQAGSMQNNWIPRWSGDAFPVSYKATITMVHRWPPIAGGYLLAMLWPHWRWAMGVRKGCWSSPKWVAPHFERKLRLYYRIHPCHRPWGSYFEDQASRSHYKDTRHMSEESIIKWQGAHFFLAYALKKRGE